MAISDSEAPTDIELDNTSFTENEAGAVVGTLSIPGAGSGTPTTPLASLSLSALDGTNGFRLDGVDESDQSGYSVSSAGDVNGDGYGDIIIGTYSVHKYINSYAGESYVVFGKGSGFSASLDLSSLDGSTGFRLNGVDAYDYSGRSVSSAGDVNGDGYGDVIIGAYKATPDGNSYAGKSYVVFGKTSGWSSDLDLSSLDPPVSG